MKKKKSLDYAEEPGAMMKFEETLHEALQLLQTWKKELLCALLITTAALFGFYKLATRQSQNTEMAFLKADNEYAVFRKTLAASESSDERKDALAAFEELLAKDPGLNAKYDGAVAQALIAYGDTEAAMPFAERTLARTSRNDLPLYNRFADTSLAIAKKDYVNALSQARSLQSDMAEKMTLPQNERGFQELLFAYNMVRIAFLEQEAGSPSGELSAWQTFKERALDKEGRAQGAFKTVITLFSEGQISLLNYMEAREKLLGQA